jgi:hypothetical protein
VERTRIEDADAKGIKKGFKIGEEIGLVKGEEIGLVKGEEIGLVKGIEQGAKIYGYKTAVNGFKKNLTDADISELTGLTTEVVVRLRALFNKYGQETESHFDES